MKVLSLCFLSLILFTFGTCKNDPAPPSSDCGKLSLLDANLYTDGPDDRVDIDSVWISGSCLTIEYAYGGGCGDTELNLVGVHDLSKQWPRSASARFSFKDRDNCEAYIHTSESFDLKPLQFEGENTIDIKIDGWAGTFRYEY